MKIKSFAFAVLAGLAGVSVADTVDLAQYKWAVIGDEFSDKSQNPKPKYVDIVAEKTGIQIAYENVAATGYWVNNEKGNAFYQRIKANPVPSDVDVITLFGTMNDVNYDSTRYKDDQVDVFPGEASDRLPSSTYAAYVNAAIDALIEQAPRAKIVMVGPLYRQGPQEVYQKDYITGILRKVAAYRGIEFHNWYDGLTGDPLDYFQIKTDDAFAQKYVYNYPVDGVAKKSWYGIPSAAYHADFIAPQMQSILGRALVGAGVPKVAPELDAVKTVPWGSSVVFYSSLVKIGTVATACDVYLAYGEDANSLCEPIKVLSGKTGSFEYELKGLGMNKRYFYSVTVRNNSAEPMVSTAVTGSFTTTMENRPDWSAKKWAVIGDSISDPDQPWGNPEKVVKYYHYVSRDTRIQVTYTNCFGSTGYAHRNNAHNIECFYRRLLQVEWRIPSDVDVVTIFGSANDCDWSGNVGAATDTFENGKSSYSAYVNGTIDLIREQVPKAKIVLVSGFWCFGLSQSQLDKVTEAIRKVAELKKIPFYNWAVEDPDDPLDIHHLNNDPTAEGSFARQYTVDWDIFPNNFGHPNNLYNEIYLSPRFRAILTTAFEEDQAIKLGEPESRPLTDYSGSSVSVSFAGDVPDGADVSAKVTIDGVDYAGTVKGTTASFMLPGESVLAGQVYYGTITLTVDGVNYTKNVMLTQGVFKVDENSEWIRETAANLNATGTWTGEKVVAASGKIAVSNAVFTAAKPSPAKSVVTVVSTFDFGGTNDGAFAPSSLAGVKVVKVGQTRRYVFLTGTGAVTNLDMVANVRGAVEVTTKFDFVENALTYMIGDKTFGPFPCVAGAERVSGVNYVGETKVDSLAGAYRYEGVDAKLAKGGETEYATVAEAVASGAVPVTLLWDASWTPEKAGDYKIAKDGYNLVIGGDLAYSVKDNGDGTVTVTVVGGDSPEEPKPASITLSGTTVKVGVEGANENYWYALLKTTNLADIVNQDNVEKLRKDLPKDAWVQGSEILELEMALAPEDKSAFYRVVVSTTAP